MTDEILREIRSLKDSVGAIQRRIFELEGRVLQARPSSEPTRAVLKSSVPQAAPVKVSPARSGQDVETAIGRYWLNRLGIFSLVLGVVFFVLYSFQYLGAVAKLGVGFSVGLSLVGLGVWMEGRKIFPWYARGLMGGGWAILYFTVYAMYHIAAVRVIDSALLDLFLLTLVTGGAVGHSLKYRSDTVTALAFLFGFITTSISQVDFFTLWATALLAAALVVLVARMQWHRLALYGAVATYLTHGIWFSRQIGWSRIVAVHVATAAEARLWLSVGFILLYWLTYVVASFLLEEKEGSSKNRLVTLSLVNTLAFAQLAMLEVSRVFPDHLYLACAGVGLLSLFVAALARRRGRPGMSSACFLAWLGLVTVAIPLKLSGYRTSFLWLTEMVILTCM